MSSEKFQNILLPLAPDNEYLWQYPDLKPKNKQSEIWYTKAHFGKIPLGNCDVYVHVTRSQLELKRARCKISNKGYLSLTKILSDKYPLLLILHLAHLSSSCDLVMCTYTSHPPLWKEPKLDLKDF